MGSFCLNVKWRILPLSDSNPQLWREAVVENTQHGFRIWGTLKAIWTDEEEKKGPIFLVIPAALKPALALLHILIMLSVGLRPDRTSRCVGLSVGLT